MAQILHAALFGMQQYTRSCAGPPARGWYQRASGPLPDSSSSIVYHNQGDDRLHTSDQVKCSWMRCRRALRRHRDEGWPIPPPRKRANPETPIDVERYIGGEYGDLFMRGSDLSGLDDAGIQLVQSSGQACAQGSAPNLVSSGAGAATQGDDQADEMAPADAQLEEIAVGDVGHTTLVRLWNRVLNTMQVQTSRNEFNTWVR